MDPILGGLLLGGLTGVGKFAGNVAGNESDKKRAATTEKWSPWTGQKANAIRHANFLGDVAPSVGMGLALGQSGLLGDTGGAVTQGVGSGMSGANLGVDMSLPGVNPSSSFGSLSPWAAASSRGFGVTNGY